MKKYKKNKIKKTHTNTNNQKEIKWESQRTSWRATPPKAMSTTLESHVSNFREVLKLKRLFNIANLKNWVLNFTADETQH